MPYIKFKIRILLFIMIPLFFTSCQKDSDPVIKQELGQVFNYSGADHCGIIIELENGSVIIPLQYPADFKFYHGQQLRITYAEIPNVISTCGMGASSAIYEIEELSSGPEIIKLSYDVFNSLVNDPVLIHDISLVDDHLIVKIMYSGGCRNHTFNLIMIDRDQQPENTAVLALQHDSNNDYCEAALTIDLKFDISSIKEPGYTNLLFKAKLFNGEIFTKKIEID